MRSPTWEEIPAAIESLLIDWPDLEYPLSTLAQFARRNPSWQLIDLRMVPWMLCPAYSAAQAVLLLVSLRILKVTYMVVTPSGVLADGEWDSPADVPETVCDRFMQPFATETRIVPVLKAVTE